MISSSGTDLRKVYHTGDWYVVYCVLWHCEYAIVVHTVSLEKQCGGRECRMEDGVSRPPLSSPKFSFVR